jgi:LysR family transcriptional regulator (chromosome initiation inhibitor)
MQVESGQLAALLAVLREGSFERAARVLHVTPSAVSQRIKLLEERLGAVLVVRSTPCQPTPRGRAVYKHAQQLEVLERELLGSLPAAGAEDGTEVALSIAANADSLATWLVPALVEVGQQAGVRVEVVVDDQDHTAEWLRSGRVLGAVTAEARPVQGCRVQPLGVMRYRATASPRFVRRHFGKSRVIRPADLRRAPSLAFDRKDELQERFIRQVLGGGPGELRAHFVPSPTAYIEASLLGLGWGLNPEALTQAHLEAGRLVELVPRKWLDVPLYWQQWSLTSRTLDALAAALRAQASQRLRPSPATSSRR